MAHPLVKISDTTTVTGHHVVVQDYSQHPQLCRYGTWVGCETDLVETVKLSFEHDPDPLYVGWALNGTVVSSPGFPPTIFPPGNPVPGTPDVLYLTPVDDLYHRIQLTGTSGMNEACVYVQVLYSTFDDITHGNPPTYGPTMNVCMNGMEIAWPTDKVAEWEACLKRFWDRIHEVMGPVPVGPGDPVERWLARATPEQARRLAAYEDSLPKLDRVRDAVILECLLADLRAIVSQVALSGRLADTGERREPSGGAAAE